MIQELRINGSIGEIDYFTYIVGEDVSKTIFYEDTPSQVRFFARGNEFIMNTQGVQYKGYGGNFCQYMFGVDKPPDDTVRKEVVNRLIMFGAYTGNEGNIVFTDNIEGIETFYKLFFLGHAVSNYYFLVTSDFKGSNKARQREILKAVGKFLKRTSLIEDEDCAKLIQGVRNSIREEHANIFIFKLIHRNNNELYSVFRDFYLQDRAIGMEKQLLLDEIVRKNNIDEYQMERMKIDVMYRHPENKTIVDEYRDILIDAGKHDMFHPSELARLRRLRTLGIRNNIPPILFDTLDTHLLRDRKFSDEYEPDYFKEARGVFENLFFKDPNLKKHIIKEDIVRLLKAKHTAHEKSDMAFEQIVLDAGKVCDELVRETNDFTIFEELSGILTYFDRYDNVSSLLNNIAFTEKMEITEDALRSLIGNKKEFDQLQQGLFEKIFAQQFLANRYITSFGKKRIDAIFRGLYRIISGDSSVRDVMTELKRLTDEERMYKFILKILKDRIKDIYPRLDTRSGRDGLRKEIETALAQKGLKTDVPERIFEKVVFDIKKEAFYINHVLPKVIQNRDMKTREDFLQNSGLDRFYIETLEKDYLRDKGLSFSVLEEILAEGSNAT
ncbi:MAG: TIGR04442 family protein [bacterium]